ncbi:MAG: NADPH:quinone oxidoreductase [Anaerolineales bacterium]|nr:zinc-binding dehydrogenase [Anaerolineae bacterium]PWB56226.1 MAG: NADPH:quinone oxidoreductase [Anaerolineales bacterium]
MKAMIITAFGGPEVFQEADWPKPVPQATEVLVRVYAAAINPVDYKIRKAGRWAGVKPPAVLGYDAAGVVEAVGVGVKAFKPGDEVYYSPSIWTGQGSNAEYQVSDESIVAHKPRNLSFIEASALPLAGMTAWDAMQFLQPKPGATLLVHAAAGGVGSLAVQIAKEAGARVLGTCRKENQEMVKSLGVDLAIDYHAEDFVTAVQRETGGEGVDGVYDTVGGNLLAQSINIIKPHGRAVTCVNSTGDLSAANPKNITIYFGFMERARAKLEALRVLVERQQLKPVIDSVIPLEEVAAGHRQLEAGGVRGKIVLQVIG